MSSVSMACLSSDIFYDILRHLDGPSLASCACTCASLSSISREETLWENACKSLWPSTDREDVKDLILSIGGFRRFYADCFPLIVNKEVSDCNDHHEYSDDWTEAEYYGDTDGYYSFSPDDFVSLVDVRLGDRIICSKVLWGMPGVSGSNGWFSCCPFRVDLVRDVDGEELTVSIADGLEPVVSLEKERKDGRLWRDLRDRLRLSWIVVNTRMKKAANVSSWRSLGGHRHWPTEKDFVIRFGSVLPATRGILDCSAVKCVLVMKYGVVRTEEDGYNETELRLTELSMKLEDMEGVNVNGRKSLSILGDALSCRRSRNYSEALESCEMYMRVQSELREEKMRSEHVLDRIFILSGIAAFLSFCYCLL